MNLTTEDIEMLEAMSELSAVEYGKARHEVADRLGVHVKDLDAEVEGRRGNRDDGRPITVDRREANVVDTETEARPVDLRLRTAAEILAEPGGDEPETVVPRLVYGGRSTLLAAREKDGKSTLAASAIAAVSTGSSFLDDPVERGDVLLVALDEHPADAARRLVRFRGDPESVHVLEHVERDVVEEIGAAIEAVRPRLVVVDALANVAAFAGVSDPHASAGWVPLLQGLTRPIRETGAGLLILHHSRRSDGEYRDSSAIGASVDAIATMFSDGRTRTIRMRARWPAAEFAVRLAGDIEDEDAPLAYELTSGELSLDTRVLLYIEAHEGESTRQVRSAVTGRSVDIARSIAGLAERAAIVDRGDGRATAWYPARGPGEATL